MVALRVGPHEWVSDSHFFTWGNHKIFVKEAGRGKPLLLLHGYPVGSYDWHAIWAELSEHYRVVTLDALGYGYSDKPTNADYSLAAQVALFEDFISKHLPEGTHVLAHDMGVTIAQEMLARRLERNDLAPLHSVVFLNGAVCPPAYQPRAIQRLLVSPLGATIGPLIPKRAFGSAIQAVFSDSSPPDDALIDDFWYFVQHAGGRRVTHRVGAIWHERMTMSDRLQAALLDTATPLKFINGNVDPNSGIHMMKALRAIKPDADIVHLEQVGHWPQIEQPERTVREVRMFHERIASI